MSSNYYNIVPMDAKSTKIYMTEAEIEDYKENVMPKVIQNYKNGVSTMRQQIALSKLISITFNMFKGDIPISRASSTKTPVKYIQPYLHDTYREKYLDCVLTTLNTFNPEKGAWDKYCMFAQLKAIDRTYRQVNKDEKYDAGLEVLKEAIPRTYYIDKRGDKIISKFNKFY